MNHTLIKQTVTYAEKNLEKLMRKTTIPDHSHYAGKCRVFILSIYNSRYKMPKEIPVVLQDEIDYDYHFIIKELIEEIDGQFECLGENTKKQITFSIQTNTQKLMIPKPSAIK